MARWLRMFAAMLVGLVIGSVVNMGLIMLGGQLVLPPAGVDTNSMEGLKAALPLFAPQHYLFPFLAHALGTFVGALVAVLIAPQRSATPAWVVGGLFLVGGLVNVVMLPAPLWFEAADLLLAYLPMAWLAQALARKGRS